MKISTHILTKLLLPLIILAWTSATAQNLDKKISINLKNVTIEEAIKAIGKEGNIYFSYSAQVVDLSKTISIKAKNRAVKDILDAVLKKNNLEYVQVENQIIIRPGKAQLKPDPLLPPKDQVRHTISGTLRDAESGEPLIGAYAYAKGTTLGTTTNAYGFYSLNLPEGNYSFVLSLVGYNVIEQEIELRSDQTISVDLKASKMEITTVEIKADNEQEIIRNSQSGIAKIDTRTLDQLPGVAGDVDIVKSLQSVPGIKTYGDGSAHFFTRGGKSDQNLILVDEVPVFNPSHLFGFVSILAPEAIKDISVYKGDAPANLGGRLSSVVDIRTRDGNLKRFGFSGNLGIFVSDISIEGPFKRDWASWLIAGRISNLNWIFKSTVDRNFKMNFFDLSNKMNFKLNNKNRLYVTFYYGQDVFTRSSSSSTNIFGITWNNLLGAIRWNHIFNTKLFCNTTVYYSRYNYKLLLDVNANDYWKSTISNSGIKSDFTWYLNPANTVRMGIEGSPHYSDPGNTYFNDELLVSRIRRISKYNAVEYALYACNDQFIGEKINLKYGIRLTLWQNYGPDKFFVLGEDHQPIDTLYPGKYEVHSSFVRPEPRFIINYMPGKNNNLRFSYARTNQYIQILSTTSGPFTSMDSWVHCGPNIKPQESDLFALGYFQRIYKSQYTLSAEAYYRQFYNTVDFAEHADLLYNPLLESQLRFGKSWSYGIELMFRKNIGNFTGWVSYTYSHAWTKIEDLNAGRPYIASFDVPHEIGVSLSYDTYKRWQFVANWVYHTGSPITTPTGFYYVNGISVPYYSKKNNDRLPDYHRLDLSIVFRISKPERRYQHSLNLNIFNVYARNNPFSVNFNKFEDADGNFLVPANSDTDYERVPTLMSVAGIIPSLNYKFRF